MTSDGKFNFSRGVLIAFKDMTKDVSSKIAFPNSLPKKDEYLNFWAVGTGEWMGCTQKNNTKWAKDDGTSGDEGWGKDWPGRDSSAQHHKAKWEGDERLFIFCFPETGNSRDGRGIRVDSFLTLFRLIFPSFFWDEHSLLRLWVKQVFLCGLARDREGICFCHSFWRCPPDCAQWVLGDWPADCSGWWWMEVSSPAEAEGGLSSAPEEIEKCRKEWNNLCKWRRGAKTTRWWIWHRKFVLITPLGTTLGEWSCTNHAMANAKVIYKLWNEVQNKCHKKTIHNGMLMIVCLLEGKKAYSGNTSHRENNVGNAGIMLNSLIQKGSWMWTFGG